MSQCPGESMQATRLAGAASVALVALALLCPTACQAEDYLKLERKIALGDVRGRIDHLAVDAARRRLFVAELGNDTVGVVDFERGRLLNTITGLREPQGVGYVPSTDTLYVANARDGSVRLFQGADYSSTGRIDLGDDADNVRVDEAANRVFVGYGSGGIAVIDAVPRVKVSDIPLKAHPEGFQLAPRDARLYANVPDARHVAVVDLGGSRQIGSWSAQDARSNFPMAIDGRTGDVLVAFRRPARLVAFSPEGHVVASLDICGDADDVFADSKRRRLYVSCGEGFIDIVGRSDAGLMRLGRVPTVSGARTAYFHPDADRLFVAVRATAHEPAGIWVYRPIP